MYIKKVNFITIILYHTAWTCLRCMFRQQQSGLSRINQHISLNIWGAQDHKWMTYAYKVRPRLSGHVVRTAAYLDKRFAQIWELCLNTASSVRFIQVIMDLLIATLFVTNHHSYEMEIAWNTTEIHPLCFLSKILCGNEWKIDSIHCKIAAE